MNEYEALKKELLEQVEAIKSTGQYRYIVELVEIFHKSALHNAAITIPLHAVMLAPVPDYLALSEAASIKMMFVLAYNNHRLGEMMDKLPGFRNQIILAELERGKSK